MKAVPFVKMKRKTSFRFKPGTDIELIIKNFLFYKIYKWMWTYFFQKELSKHCIL